MIKKKVREGDQISILPDFTRFDRLHEFFFITFYEEYVTRSLMGQPSQINMDHKPWSGK